MLLGSIVLAGGRSRRMGSPKESLPIAGNTLLGRIVETLILCTYPVLVVARAKDQALPPLPIESELIYDEAQDCGPLVAMQAGMRWHEGQCDAVFVCGCDMPFVDSAAIGWLAGQLGDSDAVVPRVDGVLQPLCAVYALRTLAVVDALVREGQRAPRALPERIRTRFLEAAEIDAFEPRRRFLRSIDTQADYEAARRELGG
jgi:molybdenum cofactor guanylyltransferase